MTFGCVGEIVDTHPKVIAISVRLGEAISLQP